MEVYHRRSKTATFNSIADFERFTRSYAIEVQYFMPYDTPIGEKHYLLIYKDASPDDN